MGRANATPLTEAQRKLADDNVPLARFLAIGFRRHLPKSVGATYGDDVESDAMLGLVDAARGYDAVRGIQFDTYAGRRINGAMIDGLRRRCFVSRAQLRKGNTGPAFHSISRTCLEGETRSYLYADTLEDPSTEADNERRDAHDQAEALIALCPVGQSRRVLSLYYLDGLTMKRIGEEIGISESRVSQLCTRALADVRRAARKGE